jgi:hypothetical protein
MKKNVSSRDLELLSEYLDGRLDARKRARLEAQIKSNTELADTLHDLSQTRALLRSLPKVKARRSFKLTPEMAGKRAAPRLYPVFQFASVLASLLLVLVLAGDFLGIGARSAMPAAPPVAAPALMASAPTVELTAQAFAAPSESQMKSLASTPAVEQDQTAPNPSLGAGAAQPTEGIARSAAAGIQETPVPSQTVTTAPGTIPPAPGVSSSNPSATQPTIVLNQTSPNRAATPTQTFQPAQHEATPRQPFPLSPIRIGEIVLALVALGSGLAAYFLRRV